MRVSTINTNMHTAKFAATCSSDMLAHSPCNMLLVTLRYVLSYCCCTHQFDSAAPPPPPTTLGQNLSRSGGVVALDATAAVVTATLRYAMPTRLLLPQAVDAAFSLFLTGRRNVTLDPTLTRCFRYLIFGIVFCFGVASSCCVVAFLFVCQLNKLNIHRCA